ncbi:hypothetical protein RHJ63_02395 [Thermosynechococcus sp. JY1334]|uniref:hypothetical protein n=1 Tax=unclassified Thermosynechococcus TaxID=2622553 RepID=UPI002672A0F2|nr:MULTISPECIES: hypothetical protein [unclassified Thermosynechococcus]MDR7897163.1 hypothetical protein [Thermosynechococcus sp. JY1332]MDR7904561.1 hypothetical protein [Thermosynechococcus sp. JY1334]WKT86801.1 hypothetical protein QYC30_02390 [Thermosynechococcus sp. JY1339]WNC55742.1 hypothetical protein RHJ31_02380 [Thermosynechococcus sp. JY1331]
MTIEQVELPRRVSAKFQASQLGLFCLHLAQFVGDRQCPHQAEISIRSGGQAVQCMGGYRLL